MLKNLRKLEFNLKFKFEMLCTFNIIALLYTVVGHVFYSQAATKERQQDDMMVLPNTTNACAHQLFLLYSFC